MFENRFNHYVELTSDLHFLEEGVVVLHLTLAELFCPDPALDFIQVIHDGCLDIPNFIFPSIKLGCVGAVEVQELAVAFIDEEGKHV